LDEGRLAPISFLGGPLGPAYESPSWFGFWERYVGFPFPQDSFWRDLLGRSGPEEHIHITDLKEAEAGVNRNLSLFLSYRFAGIRRWTEWIQGLYGLASKRESGSEPSTVPSTLGPSSGGNVPPPPSVAPGGGIKVQVSCLTPGLRIHISPAYFISWVYFGSPTTPVTSYVYPGRYIFAGDGPMLPRRKKDSTVFCIPAELLQRAKRFS
jgi:hypothetical protein